jgi:uncharacterized damage-inducible protein DinB
MRTRPLILALALALAAPLPAQGFMASMHNDVNQVEQKIVALAKAMPESTYAWRPAPDVRTAGEVLLHVAADNYLIPVYMGKAAPAATGITGEYSTSVTYEKRKLNKAQIVAELEASFKHLHEAMGLTTDANANEQMKFFGSDVSRQRAMIGTVTHLHEHLGQMIAYARSVGVKPPWSN